MKKKSIKKISRYAMYSLLLSIAAAFLVFSVLVIVDWVKANVMAKEQLYEYAESFTLEKNYSEGTLANPVDENSRNLNDETPTQNQIQEYRYLTELPFFEADFEELKEINPDIAAFIHFDNLHISYPIMQKEDDDSENPYYLTHNLKGEEYSNGWLYVDHYRNLNPIGSTNLAPYGANTVIYGNARGTTAPFAPLLDTLSKDWQSDPDNYIFWVTTPTYNYVFQIFSVYTIYPEKYYRAHVYSSPEVKKSWYKTMQKRSIFETNVFLNTDDVVLTLSSIPDELENQIVVQAKLIKSQKRQ